MCPFLMVVGILYGVFRVGQLQISDQRARPFWPVIFVIMLAVWTAY